MVNLVCGRDDVFYFYVNTIAFILFTGLLICIYPTKIYSKLSFSGYLTFLLYELSFIVRFIGLLVAACKT